MQNLKYEDRCKIEALYKAKHSQREIARIMGVHYNTINRELKRGWYTRLDSELREYRSYSADIAQQDYEWKQSAKGAPLKIGKDYALVSYIEDRILNDKLSPDAVLGRIKQQEICFETTICKTTLYSYIDKGVFLRLTSENVRRRKKKGGKRRIVRVRNILSRTIEDRPREVDTRETFGHWEIDTVRGRQKSKPCLLTLTERKTRYEIIRKLKDGTQQSLESALTSIKKQYGSHIFKTITCDNGSEFNAERIEEIICPCYYCNPYCAWERGSNENANRLIRRFIPKGANMAYISKHKIKAIEDWINNMPRKVLKYRTSAEEFEREVFFSDKITKTY